MAWGLDSVATTSVRASRVDGPMREDGPIGSIVRGTLPLYVGGSAEWGDFWLRRRDAGINDLSPAGSIFAGADSLLGPVFLGYCRAEGRSSFYLTFGSLLRTLDGF